MSDWLRNPANIIPLIIGAILGAVLENILELIINMFKSVFNRIGFSWQRRGIWKSPHPNRPRIYIVTDINYSAKDILIEAPLDLLENQGFLFGWLRTQDYIPIYGTGIVSYPKIRCIHDPTNVFTPPNELKKLFATTVKELKAQATAKNRPFEPRSKARLLGAIPPVEINDELIIKTGYANYHQYRASQELLLRDRLHELKDDQGRSLELRSRFNVTSRSYDSPIVCGVLGVEITLITSDDKVVIVKRNKTEAQLQNLFLATIGEGIEPVHDKKETLDNSTLLLDPFHTVVRGAKEELGIDIAPNGIKFFALGIHKATMDPDLLGVLKVPHTQNDLEYSILSARARDRWESNDLQFIDFNPKSVSQFIKLVGIDHMTPAAPICLIFSLLTFFPEKQVIKAFTN